ncbi:MAG TPA: ABC transporter substrate-binding protein [Egibacteraceae bacterium]|nr:ABC transporter substrate-binding protein [Egibacteraceae bacterium]
MGLSRRQFMRGATVLGAGAASAGLLGACSPGQEQEAAPGGNGEEGLQPPPGAQTGHIETSPDDRHAVHINQAFQALLYLPLYIANDVGFFDEEGIDLQVTTAGGGTQSWSAVVGGSADYSIHDPIFPSISAERGQADGVVVGTICNGQAILAVTNDQELEVTTDTEEFMVDRVEGRRVATQPEPDSQWVLMRYLGELYGVEMNDAFENMQVTIGTEIGPVLQDQADIALAFPPMADIGLAQGLHELFDFSHFFGPFALSGLCTRRSYIDDNPVAHQGVMNALEKACQYAYAFPESAIEIAQHEFPDEDPEVIASAAERCLARMFVPTHAFVDTEAWRQSQNLNLFAGNIEEFHTIDDAVNNDAALRAYRSIGLAKLTLWQDGPREIADRVAT